MSNYILRQSRYTYLIGKAVLAAFIEEREEVSDMLEARLKQAAINTAVDVSRKRMKKAPERCARNLLELAATAYPDQIDGKRRQELYLKLLDICKRESPEEAKDLISRTFR